MKIAVKQIESDYIGIRSLRPESVFKQHLEYFILLFVEKDLLG